MFRAATYPSIFMELSDPDMLLTTDEALKPILATMNLIKIDVLDIIKNQPKEKVDYLYEISMINRTAYKEKYFVEGKKTCFVLTSNPVNSLEVKSYFNQTLLKYPNYTLVAKPHPSGTYPQELIDWITSKLNMKIFENQQIPTAFIYSAFPGQLVVGGYQSSSLTSIKFEDIPFVYVKNGPENLLSPFNIFYQNGWLTSYLMPYNDSYTPYIPTPAPTPEITPEITPDLTPGPTPYPPTKPSNKNKIKLFLAIGLLIIIVAVIAAVAVMGYFLFNKKRKATKKVSAALLDQI